LSIGLFIGELYYYYLLSIYFFGGKFMTVNQRVSGSSPEGGALKMKGLQRM
jgi:hypothetical protein